MLVATEFLPIGLLSSLARDLHLTKGVAGLSVTAPGLIAAVAAPALAVMVRRSDRRIVLVVLTASIAISNLFAALAPNFATFLLARLILGVAVGGLWTFGVAVGRRLVAERSGARATSIISIGICAGTVFGMPVGAVLGDWVGWRVAFAANGAFSLFVLLMQLRVLPRLPAEPINVGGLVAFAKVPMARIVLIASGFVAAGHFIAYTFLEPYLRDGLKLGQSGVALALAGYAIVGIVGSFLGERLADRGVRRAFIVASAALGISVVAAAEAAGAPAVAIIMVMIWGTAFGAVPVCIQIWNFTAAPDLYEAGSALMVSAFQISLSVGSAIGGMVVDSAGINVAFLVSGIVSLAGAATAWAFQGAAAPRCAARPEGQSA